MTQRPPADERTGVPREDPRDYRRALGHFATGVTVITTVSAAGPVGLTANSFSSVSLEPPLILWSLARSAQSMPAFMAAPRFSVNVLAAEQMDVAGHFARSGPDKFVGVAHAPGTGGVPLLPGCAAWFECRTHSRIDAGDHVIVLGEVERFMQSSRPLLLFAQGRFGLAVDHPAAAADATSAVSGSRRGAGDTMLGLLWSAFSRMSTDFQSERDAEGLHIDQGRVLSLIERNPGASADLLARRSFVSPPAVDEIVESLVAAGYARRRADGSGFEVTATGLERVRGLRQRAAAFEARMLEGIRADDLDAAVAVLRRLGTLPE